MLTYFISILIFLVISIGFLFVSYGSMLIPLDFISLASILLLTVPVMAASGLWKDFFAGFGFALKKECPADKNELQRSYLSLKMFRTLLIFSSCIVTLLGVVAMLRYLDDPAYLGPTLATALLAVIYAILASILLLPLQTRLKLLAEDCAR